MEKIYYLDDNNNIVNIKQSTHFVIQKYDNNGNLVNETFGLCTIRKEQQDIEHIKYTDEELEFLSNIKDDKGNHPFKR